MCFQIIPLCPGCEEPSGLGEEIIYAEDICSGHCTGDDVVGTTTRLMTRYEVDHCYDDDNAADAAVATVTTPVSIFEDDDEDDDDENDSSFSPPRQQGTTAGGGGASSKRFFECLTPGCDAVAVAAADGGDPEGFRRLSAEEEEQEVQGARDHAKVFLREKYENCLSLCILPFVEAPVRLVLSSIQLPSDSESPPPSLFGYGTPPSSGKPVSRRGVRQERPWSKKRGKPWGPDEEAILWKLRRRGMEFDVIASQIDRTERGCYDRFNKLRNEGYGRLPN